MKDTNQQPQYSHIGFVQEQAKGMSILIIEDDHSNREIMMRVLAPLFGLCLGAENISEATKILKTNSFDIIITDICLPDTNGLDFIKEVKPDLPNTHFIIISGHETTEYFLKAIEVGVDGFIVKPVILDNLFWVLYKVCYQIAERRELDQSRLELASAHQQTSKLLAQQDKFIKDALHEINTPLAVIMTTLDLLRNEVGERPLITRIEAASRTLKTSFEDLIYHTTSGRAHIKDKAIDLVGFIKERIEYFKPIVSANALDTIVELPSMPCPIQINSVKLQRLIDNNLSNAVKYSYRNPGKIYVSLEIAKKYFVFHVKNHGPKIADVKAIFTRFYREDSTKGGYGIGLNLVKEICDEESITFKVTSSQKHGNVFSYYFPIQFKGNKDV